MRFNVLKVEKLSPFIDYIKNNSKTILLMVFVTILLCLIQFFKDDGFDGKYIEDRNGNLIGISRSDMDSVTSVPIRIHASNGTYITEKEIILYLRGSNVNDSTEIEGSQKENFNKAIDNTLSDIENSEEKNIALPRNLEDGTQIQWNQPRATINVTLFLMLPCLIVFMYVSDVRKKKQQVIDLKKSVSKSLPMFNNQLLLLLNSGLIFNDAFYRIAKGYKRRNPIEKQALEYNIVQIYEKSKDTNSSLIMLLNEYAHKLEVKEFSRLVSIISDNQYKGVNLCEKLEIESEILWDQRKKYAEDRGKLAETKLTFPLALLLLVLILITAAPAILQI